MSGGTLVFRFNVCWLNERAVFREVFSVVHGTLLFVAGLFPFALVVHGTLLFFWELFPLMLGGNVQGEYLWVVDGRECFWRR